MVQWSWAVNIEKIKLFTFVQTDLGVECGDDADNHQLKWKGNCTEGSRRGKAKEEDSLLVELLWVLSSQIGNKLDEDAQGPEDSRGEEEEDGQGSPERILFKTLDVRSKLLPPARLLSMPTALLSKSPSLMGIRTVHNRFVPFHINPSFCVPLPTKVFRSCEHVEENGSIWNDNEDDSGQDGIEKRRTGVAFLLLLRLVHPVSLVFFLKFPLMAEPIEVKCYLLCLLLTPAGCSFSLECCPLFPEELGGTCHKFTSHLSTFPSFTSLIFPSFRCLHFFMLLQVRLFTF